MGLDAVVYRNLNNVDVDEDHLTLVDEMTGEVYLEDPKLAGKYGEETFVATHRRLGNIDSIRALVSEIPAALTRDLPMILGRVLYSGSHSGDVIGADLMESLEAEVDLLNRSTGQNRSMALTTFLDDMLELIRAARAEGNPIVFA